MNTKATKDIKNQEFWTCVIGPADSSRRQPGADYPMRMAVKNAFERLYGNGPEICMSGWGCATQVSAEADLKRMFVYAVQETCSPEPELRKLTAGELLKLLANFAKDYAKEGVESIKRNNNMNDVPNTETVSQKVVDAVLVDFINYIGVRNCVDYGLNTVDLNDPKKPIEFEVENS